jgi:phosphoenolpyruvate carboxylase
VATFLSNELKSLVHDSVEVLGDVIRNQYGEKLYQDVEKIRQSMVKVRKANLESSYEILNKNLVGLKKKNSGDLFKIAHSYSLMLELINRCETAYRSHRLSQKELTLSKTRPYAIIYVFTSHPTEARASNVVSLFENVEKELVYSLTKGFSDIKERLYHLLSLLLKIPMANTEKPTVADEADYILSFVLNEGILQEQVNLLSRGLTVHFRTWVGGDKDGHPGVNSKTMKMCLEKSREKLQKFIKRRLRNCHATVELLGTKKSETGDLLGRLEKLEALLDSAKAIKAEDGKVVAEFTKNFESLKKAYFSKLKCDSPELQEVEHLLWLYPALVMPLEIREDSELVHIALKKPNQTIEKMLMYLKSISIGHDPKWYVRGFVLSMVATHEDLLAGVKLMRRVLGGHKIPVVPLFENQKALVDSCEILEKFFTIESRTLKKHQGTWNSRYEVMLGYSDSSKENGVFPSRYLIANALHKLDKFFKKWELTPVFFHGSGGSVERGGGSIKEQTRWWPKSAVRIFKATGQGEMVARNFGNSLVMRGQVLKIANELGTARTRLKDAGSKKSVEKFCSHIMKSYKATWDSSDFFEMVEKATPYGYLDQLKIGSRPSKRTTGGAKRHLRAIPWVLCWTQTRVLFPTWWGVGSAWAKLNPTDRYHIMRAHAESDLLKSFVKVLGFTLAKVELAVFRVYLNQSKLDKKVADHYYHLFLREYQNTVFFFEEVTGQKDLLWFRPWLLESISYRSSMIHPLNLLQLIALERKDSTLLRETVTGIACGMLTTG